MPTKLLTLYTQITGTLQPSNSGAAGQVTDDEGAENPGNVPPTDDPVPDALEQADTRRPLHGQCQSATARASGIKWVPSPNLDQLALFPECRCFARGGYIGRFRRGRTTRTKRGRFNGSTEHCYS